MVESASRARLTADVPILARDQRTFPPARFRCLAEGSAPPWEPARRLALAPRRAASGAGAMAAPLGEVDASPARMHIALLAIARSRTAREVVDAVMSYATRIGRRGALFLRVRGELRGWAGRGRGVSEGSLAGARLRLDSPSILAYLARAPTSYRGRVHHDGRSREFLIAALTSVPDEITAFSISAGGRVIGIAYADGTAGTVRTIRGSELSAIGDAAGRALARIYDRAQTRMRSLDRDEEISH